MVVLQSCVTGWTDEETRVEELIVYHFASEIKSTLLPYHEMDARLALGLGWVDGERRFHET